jgi:ubiquinone/menaquinone biosynthesis C-methylase UbiE
MLKFILTARWRRSYRDPARTLAPLALAPGMCILELGPGPGLFTAEAARLLGEQGQLLCIDVERRMLGPLLRLVRQAGLCNVAVQCATAERLPLRDRSIDGAYAIAVLPMVANKAAALRELRRVLRPGGFLAVSEELAEPEYVPAWTIMRWCRRAGFVPVRLIRAPLCYTLIFRSGELASGAIQPGSPAGS